MRKVKNKVKCLDLGCGINKKKGYFGIDKSKVPGVDMVYDLNKGIPFPDNSIEKIFCRHFLEHVEDPLFLIEEMYRVLKKNGVVEIIVPHWSWYGSHTFMHRTFFHSLDFFFLEPSNPSHYYTKANFKIISIKLNYGLESRWFLRPINKLFNFILNLNLKMTENFLIKFFSPKEIIVIMKKI